MAGDGDAETRGGGRGGGGSRRGAGTRRGVHAAPPGAPPGRSPSCFWFSSACEGTIERSGCPPLAAGAGGPGSPPPPWRWRTQRQRGGRPGTRECGPHVGHRDRKRWRRLCQPCLATPASNQLPNEPQKQGCRTEAGPHLHPQLGRAVVQKKDFRVVRGVVPCGERKRSVHSMHSTASKVHSTGACVTRKQAGRVRRGPPCGAREAHRSSASQNSLEGHAAQGTCPQPACRRMQTGRPASSVLRRTAEGSRQ